MSTSSAADTPASLSAWLELDEGPTTIDTSGLTSETPLAFYDPDSRCWKTSQGTFLWASDEFSETWPSSGMTQNGIAYPLRPLVPRTSVTASSLLPRPSATEYGTNQSMSLGAAVRPSLSTMARKGWWPTMTRQAATGARGHKPDGSRYTRTSGFTLVDFIRWPTPTTQDAANNGGASQSSRNTPPLNAVVGGALNPTWVEWLMGFPAHWTEL